METYITESIINNIIVSVKNISTGQIFKVGDEITYENWNNQYFEISHFTIQYKKMYVMIYTTNGTASFKYRLYGNWSIKQYNYEIY